MPSKIWTIMASGTAIIASFDLGSEMERTIKQADCGYCVQAGDAEALADTIKDLSQQPEKVKRLGANARKYAETQIDKAQAVQKYIEIIEEMI